MFDGTATLTRSATRLNPIVTPITIETQTVPAMAGIKFALDGHPFASDTDGVARSTVTRVGRSHLQLNSDATSMSNARYTFSCSGYQAFVPERQVTEP